MKQPTLRLQTARLTLRPLDERDAAFVLELLNQPSFLRFIGDRNVRTLEQARTHIIEGPQRSYRQHGFGLLLVQLQATATPIGMCGLVKRDYLADPDVGFAFLPEYWSQGFAFEAARAVLDDALAATDRARILAIVQPDNAASIKLLHKLGMRTAGTIRPSDNEPELLLLACECQARPSPL
jgi:ribosomal-protein-alanine N-acetyltransferase